MVDFDKLREQNRLKALEAAKQKTYPTSTEGERIDHAPLTFGKYRGQTPSDIAQTDDGAKWIKWAKENVTNRPVCSDLLAKDCGWKPPISQADAAAEYRNAGVDPYYGVDLDDDIPF